MIEEFRKKIEEIDWNDTDSIVEFINRNTLYLRNLETSEDSELLNEILNLKLEYVFALSNKKYFTRAYEYLRDVDILLQKTKETKDFDKSNEKYKFAFGIITYRLKKYEEAQAYFSELVKKDPENEQYRDWYLGNYTMIFRKKSNIIIILGVAIIVFMLFSKWFIYIEPETRLWLDSIAFALMIVGYVAPYVRRFLLKFNFTYH